MSPAAISPTLSGKFSSSSPSALPHLAKSGGGAGHCVPTPSRGQCVCAAASQAPRRGARFGIRVERRYSPLHSDILGVSPRWHFICSPCGLSRAGRRGGEFPFRSPRLLLPLSRAPFPPRCARPQPLPVALRPSLCLR